MADTIQSVMKEARDKRDATRALIHNAFPQMGTEQPASSGSQSNPPDKSQSENGGVYMPMLRPGQ